MPMSAAQETAFQTANAGNTAFSAIDLTVLITGITATAILLWFVWVCISAYRGYGVRGNTDTIDIGSIVLRALFVLIITLVIISY